MEVGHFHGQVQEAGLLMFILPFGIVGMAGMAMAGIACMAI